MYRTPVRRGLSPDSSPRYRDSPHSREDSWSRGHSPARQHRSPSRRGRSPERHSRSPARHGRSPERRGRSRSRHRSRSRPSAHPRSRSRGRVGRSRSKSRGRVGRSRSKSRGRVGRSRSRGRVGRSRSRSRGRVGRSRSRPRRSPSPYSQYPARRSSPGDTYRYEGRSVEQQRLSPSYRSNAASDHRPLASPHDHDRSDGIKSFGHESSPRVYQGAGDSHAAPMPKKSILKKRVDMEHSGCDQSPQVDNYSSNMSAAGAEKNNLVIERQQLSPPHMTVEMGLPNSSSSISAPTAAENPESPLLHGIAQSTGAPTSWTLSSSTEIDMKGSAAGNSSCEQTDSPKVTPYASDIGRLLYNKSTPKSQTVPFSDVNKEGIQKGAEEVGSFLLPYEKECKSSLPGKTMDAMQRSSAEIEDEELFLYGDEEDKKPESQKPPSGQKACTPPAKGSPNKKEFEKIHDLLKTIGLDIGVAEIGKLAVRTQERLHGKKTTPKISQPAPERLKSTVTDSPADPKAVVSESQVKMEKEKEKAEAAVKTVPPVKPSPKEITLPVTQPSLAPALKEKPQLLLQKSLPKETTLAPKVEIPVQPPTPSPVPDSTPPPISPSQISMYPPYPHSPMVPPYNMPPPSYNPYTSYVSYPISNWSMYSQMHPQPSPTHMPTPPTPSHVSVPVSTPTPAYNPRSNLRVIETTADLSDAKADAKTEAKPMTPLAALLAKQEADRKNKEAEKIKVMEELDLVRKEHKVKGYCLKTLTNKVDQLRVQQGILLRKKRREKDGHKDPLLEELNNVLESAQKQIHSLREEVYTTKHKQHQLTKVAEILGVSPAELVEKNIPKKEERNPGSPAQTRDSNESRTLSEPSKFPNDLKTSSDLVSKVDVKARSSSKAGCDSKSLGEGNLSNITEQSEDVKCKGTPPLPSPDPKKSPEPRSPYLSKSEDILKSRDKSRSKSPRPCTPSSKTLPKSEEPLPFNISEIFEYYDSGSHWCEDCNAICMTLPEFLLHLHDRKHTQSVKEVKRPWVKKRVQERGATKKQKVNLPLKGPEFLVPFNGYYCELCEELFPDHTAAEEHLRAYAHNDKYKKHTDAHMNYEAVRRERKKASLAAAQEAARKQAEQKRKIAEQKHEAYEHSKSKKAKKDVQEDRKAKTKHHTSASPNTSDQRRNKTPEKEPAKNPAKNPAFGKFVWKGAENKTQPAVSSSRVDAESNKPKEEEPKALSLKPKGFAIKLLGKSSTLPGNALSPSNSVASTTITSTAPSTTSTSAPSSTPPTTSAAQTKIRPNLPSIMNIRPNLPSIMNIRPNLPSLMNIRSATPLVTVSKPAPLNTFLSIKSANATSKSIPIVKNTPTSVFPEDLVSKAFGGEVVVLKGSTETDSTDKNESKEHEKTTGQSPKDLQGSKGQDLVNVFISKKEIVDNQEVKSEKESSATKLPLSSFSQKTSPLPSSTSHTTYSAPTTPAQSPGPTKVLLSQNFKPLVPNLLSPGSSTTSVKSPISSSTNSSSNNAASTINLCSSSNRAQSANNPSNQQTGKAGPTARREESGVQQPQEAKTTSKIEKETPQEGKASTFSMNPVTGRLEYLPVKETKVKDTNVKKLPETKPMQTAVTCVSNVKPNKPTFTPPAPVLKTKLIFNATTKLNQKFKKAPLSLPSSLFGHVQDAGCKDIKITSVETQKNSNREVKPAQKQVSSSLSAKTSIMQQELDLYYKLIASEDDPEDLTTSEDQDSEAAPPLVNVPRAPLQTKGETPPEKKVKLEIITPFVKTPIRPVVPDVSGEDVDDSDMACEVPDIPLSSVSQTSGWNFMQSSYASNQTHGSSSRQPLSLLYGKRLKPKDQSEETQVSMAAAPENSVEDLSMYVTCDSD